MLLAAPVFFLMSHMTTLIYSLFSSILLTFTIRHMSGGCSRPRVCCESRRPRVSAAGLRSASGPNAHVGPSHAHAPRQRSSAARRCPSSLVFCTAACRPTRRRRPRCCPLHGLSGCACGRPGCAWTAMHSATTPRPARTEPRGARRLSQAVICPRPCVDNPRRPATP